MTSQLNLFLLNTTDIHSLSEYESYLSQNESVFYKSVSSEKRKKEFVLSRYLLRSILNIEPSNEFSKNINGKLFIKGGPEFSVSHSHEYIACAIHGSVSVGIDIEKNNKKNSYLDISSKYFHELENKFIRSVSDKKVQQINFLKLWTLKESMFKLFGLALTDQNTKLFFDFENLKIISYPGMKASNKITSALIEYKDLYLSTSFSLLQNDVKINIQEVILDNITVKYNDIDSSNYKLTAFSH